MYTPDAKGIAKQYVPIAVVGAVAVAALVRSGGDGAPEVKPEAGDTKPAPERLPNEAATSPGIAEPTRLAMRERPQGTLDVLSKPVAPGERTTQHLRLPQGWKVIGRCALAADPDTGAISPFVIESETSSPGAIGAGDYTITARNTGSAAARLICDVPYIDTQGGHTP